MPTLTSSTEGDTSAAKELTWQQAKARTQAIELEITTSIPTGKVAEVDQMTTGILLDCVDPLVNWNGATTVPSSVGTEPEPLVRALEATYQDNPVRHQDAYRCGGTLRSPVAFSGQCRDPPHRSGMGSRYDSYCFRF